MSQPRWLSADDQRSWRAYLTGSHLLDTAVEADLRERFGIGLAEYEILVRLSEHEGRSMRMAQLAADTTLSRSRLTHSVARMEKKGLLARCPIPEDGRGVVCAMTETGWNLLVSAAPSHVQCVRENLVDLLTPAEMAALGTIFTKVTRHLSAKENS